MRKEPERWLTPRCPSATFKLERLPANLAVVSQVPRDKVRQSREGEADAANNGLQRERPVHADGGEAKEQDHIRDSAGCCRGNTGASDI